MKGYRTKRIVLPGGRVIEIVYFSDAPGVSDSDTATRIESPPAVVRPLAPEHEEADESRLHVCPSCDGELVYPVAWEERDEDAWRIERRCPNCEWRHVGDYDQGTVEGFDDVLNDGTESLLLTLREYTRTNMEDDVERLIAAIHADAIQPMDF